MWPCKSVVCKIEMQTVSGSSPAATLASVGKAPSNPARPVSFKKSRRVQDLYGGDIAVWPADRLIVNQCQFQWKRWANAAKSGGLPARRSSAKAAAARRNLKLMPGK